MITRARQLVEVVSSIHGKEIEAGSSPSRRHFKRYLEYAEHGPTVLWRGNEESVGEPDSPFEESVLSALKSWGIEAVPQVGIAGYRIDIGIVHPDHAGTFVLGIECDGAMYHSAKSARDRDRLRQEVLRGLGWNLHRIWGTAWYRDRRAAEEQLRIAIEQAVENFDTTQAPSEPAIPDSDTANRSGHIIDVEFIHQEVPDGHRGWAVDYTQWQGRPTDSSHAMSRPEARPEIRRLVLEVLHVEAPIHSDVLRDRVRQAWGSAGPGAPSRRTS